MGFLQTLGELFGGATDSVKAPAPRNNVSPTIISGGNLGATSSVYSGSDVTSTSQDFLGDWRSADSWQRFDLWRVRNRSRQLERGNAWCQSFLSSYLNNVLGAKGFKRKVNVERLAIYGDTGTGQDEAANKLISDCLSDMGKAENFTTRKRMSERDADRLLLARWFFDGEVILRKIKNFPGNSYRFAWQIVDPDYLDHNLNRIESGFDENGKKVAEPGNITKMGVEMDKDWKYPVAYWLLHRRPNDYFYNYVDNSQQRYIRVPADEIIHLFQQTFDPEQTRGWPLIFAAMVNLFRIGKLEEAALINATIGASKMGFFKKTTPDGFDGDLDDDQGVIIDRSSPGMWTELPYNVEPVPWTPQYPEAEYGPFSKAMLRGMCGVFGLSYATLTNDLSEANFVSSKLGRLEEQEVFKAVQEYFIEKWKLPAAEEMLYRAMMSLKVQLPISKFAKFNQFSFRGRRWESAQIVDDLVAANMKLDAGLTAPSDIVEETTQEDFEDVLKRIQRDSKLMELYGVKRIHSTFQSIDPISKTPISGPQSTPTPQKSIDQ